MGCTNCAESSGGFSVDPAGTDGTPWPPGEHPDGAPVGSSSNLTGGGNTEKNHTSLTIL